MVCVANKSGVSAVSGRGGGVKDPYINMFPCGAPILPSPGPPAAAADGLGIGPMIGNALFSCRCSQDARVVPVTRKVPTGSSAAIDLLVNT